MNKMFDQWGTQVNQKINKRKISSNITNVPDEIDDGIQPFVSLRSLIKWKRNLDNLNALHTSGFKVNYQGGKRLNITFSAGF